jgi:hypothetical protein
MKEIAKDETQWFPNAFSSALVALVRELQMFGALVGKENKHQIGPSGHD